MRLPPPSPRLHSRRPALVCRTNSDDGFEELCSSVLKQQKTSSSPRRSTRQNAIVVRKTTPAFVVRASDETTSTVSISSLSSCDENSVGKATATNGVSVKVMAFTKSSSKDTDVNNKTALPWMQSNNNIVANKAVFHRHLIGPTIKIQAAVRRWIQVKKYYQLRVDTINKEIHEIEGNAAVVLQARVRGWLGRQRREVLSLEAKLCDIQHRHRNELAEIEAWKQREKKRIYDEVMASVIAEEKRFQIVHQQRLKLIADLKDDNADLREMNETLRMALLVVAKKNKRTMELTEQAHRNIQELERFIPRVQADIKKAEAEAAEWLGGIQLLQEALDKLNERAVTEKKIRQLAKGSLRSMMQRVREGCLDLDLTKSIVKMAKTAK